jgi:hypothetical protein
MASNVIRETFDVTTYAGVVERTFTDPDPEAVAICYATRHGEVHWITDKHGRFIAGDYDKFQAREM